MSSSCPSSAPPALAPACQLRCHHRRHCCCRDCHCRCHCCSATSDTTSAWPPRFHKLLLRLDGPDGGMALAFCDARRFGRLKLVEGDPAASDAVAKLGFDPLLAMPSEAEFAALLAARARGATRLKPLLLDQVRRPCMRWSCS